MGYLPDVNVVDTLSDNDYIVANEGNKTVQISKANLLADVGGGAFADVIDATAADYTLVAQDSYPTTQVLMNADNGSIGQVTIPLGDFTVGAIYVVTNQGVSDNLLIALADGVTCNLIESGVDFIPSQDLSGNTYGTFVNVGTNSWIAYGDIESAV